MINIFFMRGKTNLLEKMFCGLRLEYSRCWSAACVSRYSSLACWRPLNGNREYTWNVNSKYWLLLLQRKYKQYVYNVGCVTHRVCVLTEVHLEKFLAHHPTLSGMVIAFWCFVSLDVLNLHAIKLLLSFGLLSSPLSSSLILPSATL